MRPDAVNRDSVAQAAPGLVGHARAVAQVAVSVVLLWGFAALGDLASRAAGLAIPGSVIGMLLLWIALEARLVRLGWIDGGARLLLGALGLLFVPAGAGFVQFVGAGGTWLEVGAIVVVGSLLTLGVTALAVLRWMPNHD
jgi:holin-like protein